MATLLVVLCSCNSTKTEHVVPFDKSEVVGPAFQSVPERIPIDIYVDATTSMMGFVANAQSRYAKLLTEIDAAAVACWKHSDVKYFKFGAKIRQLTSREEYLFTRNPEFYQERGILETTNIDLVVSRTDPNRVSALLTDLFQNQGDVTAVVNMIKEKCFLKGIAVAIAAVPSQYNGKVYDSSVPPYQYISKDNDERSYRYTYLLLFGNPDNILRLFQALEVRQVLVRNRSVLIAPYIMRDFTKVRFDKTVASKNLNQVSKERSEFNLKSGAEGGEFETDFDIEKHLLVPEFVLQQLELIGYRNVLPSAASTAASGPGEPCQDFMLKTIALDGRTLRLTLKFSSSSAPGHYLYTLYVRVPSSAPYLLPAWVKDYSSENPTPAKDANKTLNLERFISDLLTASVSVHQPNVLKLTTIIHRK
jgi:hypothetical protein